MKKEFEELYNDLNKEELMSSWKSAKNEKSRRGFFSILTIILVDFAIFYFVLHALNNSMHLPTNSSFSLAKFGIIMPIVMGCIPIDIVIYVVFHLTMNGKNKNYNREFKEKIVNKLIENFFTNVDYVPLKGIPREMYNQPKYEGYYNRYYSDDYIDATINEKYSLKIGEVKTQKVEHHRGANGRTTTTTTTIFSGLFIKINLGESIENTLKITRDCIIYGKEKIEMDSQEFEKYFDVGSTVRLFGMEILTPDIMELLISFRKVLKENFDIYIINDAMYIRLHVGPMFESVVNKSEIVDKESVKKYYDILDFTYNLSNKMLQVIEEYRK